MKGLDTTDTQLITCPHCGYEDQETWECGLNNGDIEEWDCDNCGEYFKVECIVTRTFTTTQIMIHFSPTSENKAPFPFSLAQIGDDLVKNPPPYEKWTTLDQLTEEQAGKILDDIGDYSYWKPTWVDTVKLHINQALKTAGYPELKGIAAPPDPGVYDNGLHYSEDYEAWELHQKNATPHKNILVKL